MSDMSADLLAWAKDEANAGHHFAAGALEDAANEISRLTALHKEAFDIGIKHQATIERLTAENRAAKELLRAANCALRSAAEVALRDGKDTNWDAFRSRLATVLLEIAKTSLDSDPTRQCLHSTMTENIGTCGECGEHVDNSPVAAAQPRQEPCPRTGEDGHNHPANPCPVCEGTGRIDAAQPIPK